MILTLQDLSARTRSWLAPLLEDDPQLYAELAASVVIEADGEAEPAALPAGIAAVLAVLDLRGKEIGAFRFAPLAEDETASEQVRAFDAKLRETLEAPPEIVFVGEYGSDLLLAGPDGIALLAAETGETVWLGPDFESFILVQANAYDAYKAKIVKGADEPAYRARQTEIAAEPRFAGTDVEAIFSAQLKA
jgi:hypothetical protein